MSIVLRIGAIAVGIYLIYAVMKTMKQKKMSAGQSMLWLFSGLITIVLGIVPSIVNWLADMFDVSWPPALIITAAVTILGLISYNHAKEISILRAQVTELTEQISVMKYELLETEVLTKGTREQ